jgi:hypothetical protein
MSMIIGVTSGFWIWSRKSLNSWRKFFSKICLNSSCDRNMPAMSKLTPNCSSECTTTENSDDSSSSICCLAIQDLFRCNKQLRRKDSVVYFQTTCEVAGIEEAGTRNVPNFYDVPHSNQQQQQQQHYSNASDDFVLYKTKATLSSSNTAAVPTNTQFYVASAGLTTNLLQSGVGQVVCVGTAPFYDGYHGVTRSITNATSHLTNTTGSTNSSSLPSSTVSTARRL